jgi:lysophospholipase L1-like esterase
VEAGRRLIPPVRALLGIAAGGVVGLLVTQILLLSRRTYLPMDPGYTIDERVGAASGIPLRLAVLGDSTVAGVGSPTARESLPVLIGLRVAAATGRPVHVIGLGVSGARTGTIAHQLERLAGLERVDAIVIVIGSNDATHATPWMRFRRETDLMLARAARLADVVVLAGTPRFKGNRIIPEPLRTMLDAYSGLLRAKQREAVARRPATRFVDLAADASPRFLGVPAATSVDGFHPSPIGYGFWADALAPAVTG